MRITVIGCGNIGGAIIRGLVNGSAFKAEDITAVDINPALLDDLRNEIPAINIECGSYESIPNADILLIAVKPWLVEGVIDNIKFKMDYERQILVSIAAGIEIADLEEFLSKPKEELTVPVIFRVIPNTAISICKSVNLIATNNASDAQKAMIVKIFDELGVSYVLGENLFKAGIGLTSSGIAYIFRYIRAATQAAVEMGFYPKMAQEMVTNTMLGAAELLRFTGENPETEIDKVTTPGGITIRGLNELEANGFSSAIIKGIKASKF